MSRGRDNEWNSGTEIYSPAEVESVLRAAGVEVREETENDFLSFCPYHGNTDSPAFSTSKRYGYSICFNPSCAKGSTYRLTLEGLAADIRGLDKLSAKRFVMNHRLDSGESFEDKFEALDDEPEELPEFPDHQIKKMHQRFLETPAATDYMAGRGFELATMEHFSVGFTPASQGPVYRAHDMVVVPAYDNIGRPVGLVGRSIEGKNFKNFGPNPNGTGFHKSKIIWNLHNAKRHETVIVTEATFDAMRIHQAGYPNVVALLGGSLSKNQIALFSRHFSSIIIFTDNENKDNDGLVIHKRCAKCLRQGYDMCQGHAPGRDLGMKIAETMPRLKVSWATYDDRYVYANNVKDAAGMSDADIRRCLKNQISHFEYLDWMGE